MAKPSRNWPAMEKFAMHNGRFFLFVQMASYEDDDRELVELTCDAQAAAVASLPTLRFNAKDPSSFIAWSADMRFQVRIDRYEGLVVSAKGGAGNDSLSHPYLPHCFETVDGCAFVLCEQHLLAVPCSDQKTRGNVAKSFI